MGKSSVLKQPSERQESKAPTIVAGWVPSLVMCTAKLSTTPPFFV